MAQYLIIVGVLLLPAAALAAWSALGPSPRTNEYGELWQSIREHQSAADQAFAQDYVIATGTNSYTNTWARWPSYYLLDYAGDQIKALAGLYVDQVWLTNNGYADLAEYLCDESASWTWTGSNWVQAHPSGPTMWSVSNLWAAAGIGTQYVVETVHYSGTLTSCVPGWSVGNYTEYEVCTSDPAPYSTYSYSYPWTLAAAADRDWAFAEWMAQITNTYWATNVVGGVTNVVRHRQLGLVQTQQRTFSPLGIVPSKWVDSELRLYPSTSSLAGAEVTYVGTYCEQSVTGGTRSAVAISNAVTLAAVAVLPKMVYAITNLTGWSQDVTNGQPDSALGHAVVLAWTNADVAIYGDPQPGFLAKTHVLERRAALNLLRWTWLDGGLSGKQMSYEVTSNIGCSVIADVTTTADVTYASSVSYKVGEYSCSTSHVSDHYTNFTDVTYNGYPTCNPLPCTPTGSECAAAGYWTIVETIEGDPGGGDDYDTTDIDFSYAVTWFDDGSIHHAAPTNYLVGGTAEAFVKWSGFNTVTLTAQYQRLSMMCCSNAPGLICIEASNDVATAYYTDPVTLPACSSSNSSTLYASAGEDPVSIGDTNMTVSGLGVGDEWAMGGVLVVNIVAGDEVTCDDEAENSAPECACGFFDPTCEPTCYWPSCPSWGGGNKALGDHSYEMHWDYGAVDIALSDPKWLFAPEFSFLE